MPEATSPFTTRPLTPETWADLEILFGLAGGGVVRGCWCMFFRISGTPPWPASEMAAGRKQALRDLVDRGHVPGLIGYLGDRPAAWLGLGPRPDFARLRRSRIMKPVDDQPVWSVICSFVGKHYRGRGLQYQLLAAGEEHARQAGATILEAYPVDIDGPVRDDGLWFGSASLYRKAGFTEVARRSPSRTVVRKELGPAAAG